MSDIESIVTIPDVVLIPALSKDLTNVTFAEEFDNGDSGTEKVIDFSEGQKQKITLNNDATINFAVAPGVGHFQLRIIQDATGGRAVTYIGISASRWLGSASEPAINANPNGETIMTLFWDGAQYVQSLAKVGAA